MWLEKVLISAFEHKAKKLLWIGYAGKRTG